jgi:hypothetical protein
MQIARFRFGLLPLIWLVVAASAIQTDDRISDEQVLLAELLADYDPAARPVYNASNPVQVKFGMSYIQICDMVSSKFFLTRLNGG